MKNMQHSFSPDFFWGASTSSHQVEGNNLFNDWWHWENKGKLPSSGNACDHYHLYKNDFKLAKDMGHNTHRLGIEWSRVAKDEKTWNESEWTHYKNVINELIALNIKPIVTLNHFTIPVWFMNKGGWLDKNSCEYFTQFAVKSMEKLGDKVEYWITINEPNILAILGYYFGQWPPFKHNFNDTLTVLKNMLKAHALAYKMMNEFAKNNSGTLSPKIGIAKAVTAFHPCSLFSFKDRLAAHSRNIFHNHSFIKSLVKGKIFLPRIKQEKLIQKNTIDFIGLNYYFRQFIRHKKHCTKNHFGEVGEVCSPEHHPKAGKTTDMGWEIYPEGLYEILKELSVYKKPMIITENGLATKDDTLRRNYIHNHLIQIRKAIKRGIPVKGYLHWSLLDNFEWAEGFSKRFGLIGVDYLTQKRVVKDSAKYYEFLIRTRKI